MIEGREKKSAYMNHNTEVQEKENNDTC